MSRERTVSGMRPTGALHLGHYFGAIKNWIALQETMDCFYFVADWHALTSDYEDPWRIRGFVPELVADWLACGLDPEKCVIFQQSRVKEHAELSLILSMVTPVSWLERNPTYKEQLTEIKGRDLSNLGFFAYPVLMAADILMYRPASVPVGRDQLPHLELTREICRRFNGLYGDYFPEPQALLTPAAKCPGLDGRKMSKSYGNGIMLNEPPAEAAKKIKTMLTDTRRARRSDPGDPDSCNLFPYHELLTDEATRAEIREGCKNATMGCVECKKIFVASLTRFLEPVQERRARLTPERIGEVLREGDEKARAFAAGTMEKVREMIGF